MTKITGEGFSKEDLSEEERAQHREMFREFEEQHPYLSSIVTVMKSFKSLAVTVGILGALGAALAWASQRGFF